MTRHAGVDGFTIYDTPEETIADCYMFALKMYRKGMVPDAKALANIRETAQAAGISEEKMQTDIATARKKVCR